MAERDTLPVSTLLGSLAALVAGAALLALLVPTWYRTQESALRAERGWASTPAETKQVKSSQAERLAHYAWIDKQKGVVALPIERAMELSREELSKAQGGQGR